jgi:hypothetical protein
MVEAILNYEKERGDFDPPPAGGKAEAPPPSPFAEDETNLITMPRPASPGTHTPESLARMPIDELKALASRLECRSGNRRTMVKDVLNKQQP